MRTFGTLLKSCRKDKHLTIVQLQNATQVDAAIISKIENGDRVATRNQVERFTYHLEIDDKTAYSIWLKDKILKQLEGEKYGKEALIAAEAEAPYHTTSEVKIAENYTPKIAELLINVDNLKDKWSSNRPLNKTQIEKMKEYFHLNYTYESNRIEGNTLTIQETHLIVNEGITISGKPMREHLEAINHEEAIDYIIDIVKKRVLITEKVIKDIHYLILKGIDRKNAGIYRTVPVYISGSKHVPPQPYLVSKQMEEYIEYYNQNKDSIHPVILAANMHERLATIHPFVDGNGRTSRLVMNLILLQNGYTIANIKSDNKMDYYKALENIQTNRSNNDFDKLVLNSCLESLKLHIELAG